MPSPLNPQSLNRFSYTLNNPVRYIDPTGHMEVDPADDAGGGNNIQGDTPLENQVEVISPNGEGEPIVTSIYVPFCERHPEANRCSGNQKPQAKPAPTPKMPVASGKNQGPNASATPCPGCSPTSTEAKVCVDPVIEQCGYGQPLFPLPNGPQRWTASVGFGGSAALLMLGGQFEIGLVSLDSEGNLGIGRLSGGPLTCIIFCAELGPALLVTNATADKLEGPSANFGISAGAIWGGGIDYVAGQNHSYDGIKIHGGLAGKLTEGGPIPVLPGALDTGAASTTPALFNFKIW